MVNYMQLSPDLTTRRLNYLTNFVIWLVTSIAFVQLVSIGRADAGCQGKKFWLSNISYQYDEQREFVTLTPEFLTNDLPFSMELYGFVDFTGEHGHDETNLKNHFGSLDLYKPLNTFGIAKENVVLRMFDVAVEYTADTFNEDRCYLGFRWRGARTSGWIGRFFNKRNAVFDITLFLARTDSRHGHDWWMLSPYIYFPFSICGIDCFSNSWCDIDFDNPLNESRRNSVSGQSMLGVKVWQALYAFCEFKYEDFQRPYDDAFGTGFGLMWKWYFEKPTSMERPGA